MSPQGSGAAADAAAPAAGRGRRAPRVSGEERESAILATAERLLEERSPQQISVDDLARGAGISRPSFYFYFPSKEAVFLALIDRLVAQADEGREQLLEHLAEDPAARWREALETIFGVFGAHRAVSLAGAEIRAVSPEARALWSGVMEQWVADTAAAIEAERARGAAPAGVPARDLAVALVSMNERVLYASFTGEAPALAEERLLEVLLPIWLSAIYGTTEPG
ncbi:MAG TPA: TetR/AcrR family transcriptional regulator [Solirubrobacteraceae bacterium]|nr:TetR/AcrR family transcriptional regulator [Solirubrobacteraceae bacterium]